MFRYLFVCLGLFCGMGCGNVPYPCQESGYIYVWLDADSLNRTFRVGDALDIVQDFYPAKTNGKVLNFPAEFKLSWVIKSEFLPPDITYPWQPADSASLQTNMLQGSAERTQRYGDDFNILCTSYRDGNVFKSRLQLRFLKPGTYRITSGSATNDFISVQWADCYEQLKFIPGFYSLTPRGEFPTGGFLIVVQP